MNKEIEQTILIIQKFIQSFSIFDSNSIIPLLDETFEYKNLSNGEVLEEASNLIEFSMILEQSKILFCDRDIKIESFNIANNSVDVEVTINATMAISTPEGLRAGQNINYKSKVIFYLESQKIKKVTLIS